jgi:hypothetical protein
MSHRPPVTVSCPAGEWTRVEFLLGVPGGVTKFYQADLEAVDVRWRYFASGVPPYAHGTFHGLLIITLPVAISVSVQFKPNSDIEVVSGITSPPEPP